MANLHLILMVFALVFFGVSIFPQTSPYWNRLVSLGLLYATAAFIF